MRPIPIEDAWVPPGCVRRVLSAPNGDLNDPDVAPLEVVVDVDGGSVGLSSFWLLTDEERESIAAGGVVVLTVVGPAHPPVALGATTAEGYGR